MFRSEITVKDAALLDAYAALMKSVPDVVSIEMARTANKNAPGLKADLQRTPGPVSYPIHWVSERQRRAFFATKGFGRGIPTRRTGAIAAQWSVEVIYQPNRITAIAASNPSPVRRFVTGDEQQPFHTITGWQKDADTLEIWGLIMADDVETGLIRSFYAVGD